jgi:hypothetical protein
MRPSRSDEGGADPSGGNPRKATGGARRKRTGTPGAAGAWSGFLVDFTMPQAKTARGWRSRREG